MRGLFVLTLSVLLATSNAAAADSAKGQQEFASRCSSCHGMAGAGDGPVGKVLPPGTVTDLTKGPFKYATDLERTKDLIVKGGGALKLNAMMPPAPSIGAEELENLAAYVISLRK